jgi:hypothetical protein
MTYMWSYILITNKTCNNQLSKWAYGQVVFTKSSSVGREFYCTIKYENLLTESVYNSTYCLLSFYIVSKHYAFTVG